MTGLLAQNLNPSLTVTYNIFHSSYFYFRSMRYGHCECFEKQRNTKGVIGGQLENKVTLLGHAQGGNNKVIIF